MVLVSSFKLDEFLKEPLNKSNSFMFFKVHNKSGDTIATTFLLPEPIKHTNGIADPLLRVSCSILLKTVVYPITYFCTLC